VKTARDANDPEVRQHKDIDVDLFAAAQPLEVGLLLPPPWSKSQQQLAVASSYPNQSPPSSVRVRRNFALYRRHERETRRRALRPRLQRLGRLRVLDAPPPSDYRAAVSATEIHWNSLLRAGGIAALVAVVVFRRHIGAELSLLQSLGIIDFPASPVTAAEWFDLLLTHPLYGLLLFDLFDLVNYALVALIFLALYGALRHERRTALGIAASFCLVGGAVYLASNRALPMLALSREYAAFSPAERVDVLAAGRTLLSFHNPGTGVHGTGIYLGLFLVVLAGLIASIAMLGSRVFSRLTALCGIVANASTMGYFATLLVAPSLTGIPPSIAAPFRLIWYVLIARTLFRLARIPKQSDLTEPSRTAHTQ
jgi:hypothetical protein